MDVVELFQQAFHYHSKSVACCISIMLQLSHKRVKKKLKPLANQTAEATKVHQ